ncbi:MAG: hypothetical protein ABGZ53_26225 [Fuerstiella sp.]
MRRLLISAYGVGGYTGKLGILVYMMGWQELLLFRRQSIRQRNVVSVVH